MSIPVIDLFAGPGGLGEGFSSFTTGNDRRSFEIKISIENDKHAHQTLELRSFYRQFRKPNVPDEYYRYLRRRMSRNDLFDAYPEQAQAARAEARRAELGSADDPAIFQYISGALQGSRDWVLIGGPPCQLYSVIGRSRLSKLSREQFEDDRRHTLYREYLKIIAHFRPAVFVMENVKGIVSSRHGGESIFKRILIDLKQPPIALGEDESEQLEYTIYSLAVDKGNPECLHPLDYVIKAEEYGIPQTRHRIILLGVRKDVNVVPVVLSPANLTVFASAVLADLAPLRSGLSRNQNQASLVDSQQTWQNIVRDIVNRPWFQNLDIVRNRALRCAIEQAIIELRQPAAGLGNELVDGGVTTAYRPKWYNDPRLGGVLNHTARMHMAEDLHRYLYAACYAQVYTYSPKMRHFPTELLPNHKNIQASRQNGTEEDFDDRFRVQVARRPATTITSHISKDGHYHIHYDPTQCRSLTVREAARLQTFPDNYFFEGPRTQQYLQVGNAVPPLLAYQIAGIVHDLFEQLYATR